MSWASRKQFIKDEARYRAYGVLDTRPFIPLDLADWYVDGVNGNDANNGKSWQTAKQTIAGAITAASSGHSIVVSGGRRGITYAAAKPIAPAAKTDLYIRGARQHPHAGIVRVDGEIELTAASTGEIFENFEFGVWPTAYGGQNAAATTSTRCLDLQNGSSSRWRFCRMRKVIYDGNGKLEITGGASPGIHTFERCRFLDLRDVRSGPNHPICESFLQLTGAMELRFYYNYFGPNSGRHRFTVAGANVVYEHNSFITNDPIGGYATFLASGTFAFKQNVFIGVRPVIHSPATATITSDRDLFHGLPGVGAASGTFASSMTGVTVTNPINTI